jgi:hypothetical protein
MYNEQINVADLWGLDVDHYTIDDSMLVKIIVLLRLRQQIPNR